MAAVVVGIGISAVATSVLSMPSWQQRRKKVKKTVPSLVAKQASCHNQMEGYQLKRKTEWKHGAGSRQQLGIVGKSRRQSHAGNRRLVLALDYDRISNLESRGGGAVAADEAGDEVG